jgi:hypothetical protein
VRKGVEETLEDIFVLWMLVTFLIIGFWCSTTYCGSSKAEIGEEPSEEKSLRSPRVSEVVPEVVISGTDMLVKNAFGRYRLSFTGGLRLDEIYNQYTGINMVRDASKVRLFVITTPSEQIDAGNFSVTRTEKKQEGNEVVGTLYLSQASFDAVLTIRVSDSPETKWDLEVKNKTGTGVKAKVAFPVLGGLRVSEDNTDGYYYHGLNGGMISSIPVDIRAMYGYSLPVLDVYSIARNGGVYVRANDTSNGHKVLDLVKRVAGQTSPRQHDVAGLPEGYADVLNFAEGLGMAIHYIEQEIPSGGACRVAQAVTGVHPGRWEKAMEGYRGWVSGWYRVMSPRPMWWREVFAHRAIHDRHYHTSSGYIPTKNIVRDFDDMYVYNHWMDNRGDYYIRSDWGGIEPFRAHLAGIHNLGVRTSLYLEVVCVDRSSQVGQAHGVDWPALSNGQRFTSEPTVEWNMCAGSNWRDYISQTVGRVVSQTDPDAIYLDSVGLRYYYCEDTLHDHPYRRGWYNNVKELLRRVRAAIDPVKPDVPLYLEYVSTDINTQYMSGCFSPVVNASMGMTQQGIDIAPTGTNLFRFYFPDFKMIEIVPETKLGFGLAFFNGNGIHGYFEGGIEPVVAELTRVWRDNKDAFTTDRPEALLETGLSGIYMNKFPTSQKVIYTTYNHGNDVKKDMILRLEHKSGYHYVDLFRHTPIDCTADGKYAALKLTFEGKEVGCIGELPDAMQVDREGTNLRIKLTRTYPGASIRLIAADKPGVPKNEIPVGNHEVVVNPEKMFGSPSGKLVVQLLSNKVLVDEKIINPYDVQPEKKDLK